MRNRILAFFAAIIVAASAVASTAQALTYDQNFFSLNNILYYDPRCTNASSASIVQLAGKDNTEKILNFFMRKGLNLAQAAGFVGNMMQESGLNPAIIQGGAIADDGYILQDGVGFGLVQWTSGGRQQKFMEFMKQSGVGVTNLSGQLEFVWKEVNESYPDTIRVVKATNDPVEAAIAVHGPPTPGYEASADSPDKVRSVRGGNAKKVYDQYSDAPALAGSTADAVMTPSGEGSAATNTAAAEAPNTKDGSKNKGCLGSDGAFGGGNLAQTIGAYAWHEFTAGKTDQQPAYTAAVQKAVSEGRYVGGSNGNDCGGFVTTAIFDSGFDKTYNTNAKGGNTIAQMAWLKTNWEEVTDGSRHTGDVAINEDHTYMYISSEDKPSDFQTNIASASYPDRAPMAGQESDKDPSFKWYRKK